MTRSLPPLNAQATKVGSLIESTTLMPQPLMFQTLQRIHTPHRQKLTCLQLFLILRTMAMRTLIRGRTPHRLRRKPQELPVRQPTWHLPHTRALSIPQLALLERTVTSIQGVSSII